LVRLAGLADEECPASLTIEPRRLPTAKSTTQRMGKVVPKRLTSGGLCEFLGQEVQSNCLITIPQERNQIVPFRDPGKIVPIKYHQHYPAILEYLLLLAFCGIFDPHSGNQNR
jgi:hypothetical protein